MCLKEKEQNMDDKDVHVKTQNVLFVFFNV